MALTATSVGLFEYVQGEIRLASAENPDAMMNLARLLAA